MPNFTKKAIIDSFYKILSQKKLNQITVKDIVTDCGVNRNSFYYYFDDIPSLMNEEVSLLKQSMIDKYSDDISIEEWMLAHVRLASENKKIITNCIGYIDAKIYKDMLFDVCKHIIDMHMNKMTESISVAPFDQDLIVRLLVYEYTGLFIEWIKTGMSEDIEEQIKRLCWLQSGHVEQMLKKASFNSDNN